MNLSPSAPLPENNYLSVSEYAAIVGITISTGEENLIESTAAKICLFGSIATLTTFNHTSDEITAYPVTILVALFDVFFCDLSPIIPRQPTIPGTEAREKLANVCYC